jgi:PEP-CTERM motif
MLKNAATAALAVGLGLAGLATPAGAVTILNFAQNHATPPGHVAITDEGDGITLLSSSVAVTITDLAGPLVPPPLTDATFTLAGTSAGPGTSTPLGPITFFTQAFSGTFSVTAPECHTSCLSGTFTDAVMSGVVGGFSLTLNGSEPGTGVTFTSDVIPASFFGFDFAMALAKTDLTVPVTNDCSSPVGCTLATTSASVAGNFSSTGTIPEPSTWVMMVLGFAGLGFMGFRSSKPKLSLID